MPIRIALIDLDGTLVDTRAIDALRAARNWKGCVASLSKTAVFDGIEKLLADLVSNKIKIAVVTTSVSFYASAVLKHHKLPCDCLVAYHDARPKPAPDPFLKALSHFNFHASEAVGLGDGSPDLYGLQAARIRAIGAGWSPTIFEPEKWDVVAAAPDQILTLIDGINSSGG